MPAPEGDLCCRAGEYPRTAEEGKSAPRERASRRRRRDTEYRAAAPRSNASGGIATLSLVKLREAEQAWETTLVAQPSWDGRATGFGT